MAPKIITHAIGNATTYIQIRALTKETIQYTTSQMTYVYARETYESTLEGNGTRLKHQ